MIKVEESDKVAISFIGKLENGEIFKTVDETKPLVIEIGNSEAPPTLEISLKGMQVGDKKTVRVPPDESYGPRNKELLQTIEKGNFEEHINPRPGLVLSLKVNKDGEEHQVPATVIEIDGDNVTVDYNHPLAGHHLTYDVTVVSIEKA